MDCCKLIPKTEAFSSNFLYYLLKTNWAHSYLYAHSNGTTVLHLDMRALPKLKLPLFPLDLQQKIASRLEEFDKAILQTANSIANVKNMRQTILNDTL
jgi:restriction endonuclease S subunit